MKRIMLFFLVFLFVFCGCGKTENLSPYISETAIQTSKAVATDTSEKETQQAGTTDKIKIENYVSSPSMESTAMSTSSAITTASSVVETVQQNGSMFVSAWLSYIELSVSKDRKTRETYSAYIDGLFDNMKSVGVTDVFVQVRPFADAFYPSEIFPSSVYVSSKQGGELPFDVFGVIIERAKLKNLNIHAWLNPYRVSHQSDLDALAETNPARLMHKEDSNEDVAVTDKGIYFNPSSEKVMKLVVDGAKELLGKYDIKGIHIDDYFYFDDCGDFDSEQYALYTSQGGTLDLASWRRENVNCLVSSLYIAVKSFGADKMFSVSPAGNIDRCFNENYADIYSWCREEGYCDMIIPQIYFGFENKSQPFAKCLEGWISACQGSNVKLTVGLALYKIGQQESFSGAGKDEWINSNDIIARQAKLVKEKGCYGIALYSGTYIDFFEKTFAEELNNLKSVV